MEHSFDIDYASNYGIKEAVILKFFQYWIMKNKANGKHQYDGRTWTYNSYSALSMLFPYWNERQIRVIIQSLKDQNIIIVGNYNKSAYDRTMWYAFYDEKQFLYDTENVTSIIQKCQMEVTEMPNGNDGSVTPIPVIIPIKETIKETNIVPFQKISSLNEENNLNIKTEEKKEEVCSELDNRKKLDKVKEIFDFWIGYKGLVQHRALSGSIRKAIEAQLKWETVERLKESIENYNTVLVGKEYFYSYSHNLDDFFRNGSVQKISPYKNFLLESKPFRKFLKEKKGAADCETLDHTPKSYDHTRPNEEFSELQTLSFFFTAVERHKGADHRQWLSWYMPQDKAFVRGLWERLRAKESFDTVFEFVSQETIKKTGITVENYKSVT